MLLKIFQITFWYISATKYSAERGFKRMRSAVRLSKAWKSLKFTDRAYSQNMCAEIEDHKIVIKNWKLIKLSFHISWEKVFELDLLVRANAKAYMALIRKHVNMIVMWACREVTIDHIQTPMRLFITTKVYSKWWWSRNTELVAAMICSRESSFVRKVLKRKP